MSMPSHEFTDWSEAWAVVRHDAHGGWGQPPLPISRHFACFADDRIRL